MPSTLSLRIGGDLGFSARSPFRESDSAVSEDARRLTTETDGILGTIEESLSLFGTKSSALSDLRALANECSEANWDGEEADPISLLALRIAAQVVRALPDDIPLPEIAPEPDGAISLDWIRSNSQLLSLSVGDSLRLPYAWLDGTDRGHAVERFDGTRIPAGLLANVRRIFPPK